ncbi:hypothetical protein J3A83DRAFT_4374744 [Scleroderma citrinum]
MEKAFPLFKFAENRWKLEYICTKMYPAWSKHYLDKNGKLKCGTCDAVKEEALDKPKEDYKLSSKKVKVDTIPAAHPPKPITLPHTQSCRPSQPTDHAKVCSPLELATHVESPTLEAIVQALDGQESPIMGKSTMAQSNPQQACIAPVVEENALVVSHSNITQPVVLYNPMGLLAMAAMKVKIATVPPIPELPVKCNLGMTCISEAKHLTNPSNDVSNTSDTNTTKLKTKL